MKAIAPMFLATVLISQTPGLLLAFTNTPAREPGTPVPVGEQRESLAAVLPEFDNQPASNQVTFVEHGEEWTFYVARKSGVYVGAACAPVSRRGYGGVIRILIGIKADDTIRQIQILSQQETPGLGSKITESKFREQFSRKHIAATNCAVKKDGGEIDAITGATISSRAVTEAVKKGLEAYGRHKQDIVRTGE